MKQYVQNGILILTGLTGFSLMPERPKNLLDAANYFGLAFIVCFCGALLFIFTGILLEKRQ